MGNCTSNDPKVGVADSTKPIDTRSRNVKQTNQNGFKPIQLKHSQQNGNVNNNKSTYPETTTSRFSLSYIRKNERVYYSNLIDLKKNK